MIFGSVCSGIEAASVAWHPLDWKAAWLSEIEKFPCKVLKHHYPTVENRGDMTRFKEWPDGAIDLLVGGTPCQSFSVAGLRKGLADPRGNLMLTYGAVALRYRPRWLVWENVPGVMSSNGGRDFGSFLGLLGQLGYGFAYRVLDAQYFGVAQRRRRVFVVGYLGDWRRAAAVLFERHSLSGNPPPRREAGKGAARGVEIGPSGGDFTELNPTLDARAKDGPIRNQLAGCVAMPINTQIATRGEALGEGTGFGIGEHGDPAFTLQAGHGHGVSYTATISPALRSRDYKGTPMDVEEPALIAHILRGGGFDASEDGTGRGTPLIPVGFQSSQSGVREVEAHATLDSNNGSRRHNGVVQGMDVRRLTPRECERLQGFPDDYTAIPGAADGPRYKALGNSMAVPVMAWIGRRIQMVEDVCADLAPNKP